MLPHHLAALAASSHALWSLYLSGNRFYVPLPGEVMSEVDGACRCCRSFLLHREKEERMHWQRQCRT
jgi:hypothetical protein